MLRWPVWVAILLGILTTWAIAARIATVAPYEQMVSGGAGPSSPTWVFRQWQSFGHISNNYSPCFDDRMIPNYEGPKPHLVPWWSRMHRAPDLLRLDKDSLGSVWFNETACGWPVKAFISDAKYDGRVRGAGNYKVEHRGSYEREFKTWTLRLPYQPIWLGLIVNSLIFAAPWFLLLSIPGLFRRHRRRSRGLCVRCGYDIRSSPDVCPECGTPITSSRAQHPAR